MRHTVEISWQGTFDSAHMIPSHPKCGRLHGHTYTVNVRLAGRLPSGDGPHYLIDYGLIKEVINRLDHRLIVPAHMTQLVHTHVPPMIRIQWQPNDSALLANLLLEPNLVYEIPERDSSAECLTYHLLDRLRELDTDDRLTDIWIDVSETPKTKASASWHRAT